MLIDLDGVGRATRIKTDVPAREADLAVVFRVVEQGRWPVLMGADFHLHVSRYNDMVIDQSVRPASRRDPAFLTCGLLDRIEMLDFHSSHSKLDKLLRGEFEGSAGGALGLKDFLVKGVRLPAEEYPDTLNNNTLVAALLNLEMVLVVYYAQAFEGCLRPFIGCLQGVNRLMDLAPSGFLNYSVQSVLGDFFRTLRQPGVLERNVRGPAACAALLQADMAALERLRVIHSQNHLQIAQRGHENTVAESIGVLLCG